MMAQVMIKDLDPKILERLKDRARLHGRSLQSELKAILEEAGTLSITEAQEVSAAWQRHFEGRSFSDSAHLLREDRER